MKTPDPSRARRRAARLLISIAIVLTVSGCNFSDPRRPDESAVLADQVPAAERSGGTAVWAGRVNLLNLNPLTSLESFDILIDVYMLFMTLVQYDERLQPVPWLAESWDTLRVHPDTIQVTFRLRRDVKWHDGVLTTAHDVAFTFDRMRDPRTGFVDPDEVSLYRPHAEVLDSFTVRFWLRPHDDLLRLWAWRAIAPAHMLRDVPPLQLRTHPFATTATIGNGPFRLARTGDREWVFEANQDFPEALGGRPYLDRLVYRVIPDEQTLITALLAGEVDFATLQSADLVERLRSRGIRVLSFVPPEWVHIAWNTRLPMFRDARVRRALSLAINRQEIVAVVLRGHGEVGRSTVTPAHWAYRASDPAVNPPYDPQAAQRLLMQAGWRDRNGDGVVEDQSGRELRFTLSATHGSSRQQEVAQLVQAQLRTIGVAVEPRVLEQGTKNAQLIGAVNARGERVRSFEATLWSWIDDFGKDDTGKLHSRSRNTAFGIVGFEHGRADELMDSLRFLTNRDAARPLWEEYQRLIVSEAPVAVLYYPHTLVVVSPRLQGVQVDARDLLMTVRHWWLNGGKR